MLLSLLFCTFGVNVMKNPDSFPYPFLWSGEIPSLLFLYTSGLKNIARLGGASPCNQLLGVVGGGVPDKKPYVDSFWNYMWQVIIAQSSFKCNNLELIIIDFSDKALSLWNTSHVIGHTYWSNIARANFTSAAKHLVFHLTHSFRVTMSSSWLRGLDLFLCLCCKWYFDKSIFNCVLNNI